MKIRSDKILTDTQWIVGHSQTPSIPFSSLLKDLVGLFLADHLYWFGRGKP
jgi:hypothetical protein